jgi:hypothetical protein
MPPGLSNYYASGKPLACELPVNPYLCEFWPPSELEVYNSEYQVEKYAPNFLASQAMAVVKCLPSARTAPLCACPLLGWSRLRQGSLPPIGLPLKECSKMPSNLGHARRLSAYTGQSRAAAIG